MGTPASAHAFSRLTVSASSAKASKGSEPVVSVHEGCPAGATQSPSREGIVATVGVVASSTTMAWSARAVAALPRLALVVDPVVADVVEFAGAVCEKLPRLVLATHVESRARPASRSELAIVWLLDAARASTPPTGSRASRHVKLCDVMLRAVTLLDEFRNPLARA